MTKKEFYRLLGKEIFGTALILSFLTTSTAHSAESWTRGIGGGTLSVADVKAEAFELSSISKDGMTGHMWGSCVYYNRTPAVFMLEGLETSDGDFSPSVVNQVGNDEYSTWKTIDRPVTHGKPTTLTVGPKTRSKLLTVNLDAFVPMIGKFKYGRMVLKTGESAIFDLNYLQPPRSGK